MGGFGRLMVRVTRSKAALVMVHSEITADMKVSNTDMVSEMSCRLNFGEIWAGIRINKRREGKPLDKASRSSLQSDLPI